MLINLRCPIGTTHCVTNHCSHRGSRCIDRHRESSRVLVARYSVRDEGDERSNLRDGHWALISNVHYAMIDGVSGTAAPVTLNFRNIVGSKTGRLFPTGQAQEPIEDLAVTCIDVAVPLVIGRAADFGLSGDESSEQIDSNRLLLDRLETIRIESAGV